MQSKKKKKKQKKEKRTLKQKAQEAISTIWMYITVFAFLILWFFIDQKSYDFFQYFGWNISLMDIVYTIWDFLLIVLFILFVIGFIFLSYILNREFFHKNTPEEKIKPKHYLSIIFSNLILIGGVVYFFYLAYDYIRYYINYYF